MVKWEDLDMVRRDYFGHLLDMPINKFATQLMRHLALRQCSDGGDNELTFNLGGKKLVFGLRDFAAITGLNCGQVPRADKPKANKGELMQRYWRSKASLTRDEFNAKFTTRGEKWPSECKVRTANMYILQNVVLGKQTTIQIDLSHMVMVDNEEKFHSFPWETLSYRMTFDSVKKSISNLKFKMFGLDGFPHSLLIWAYDTIPLLQLRGYAVKSSEIIMPRLLRWLGSSQHSFNTIEADVF